MTHAHAHAHKKKSGERSSFDEGGKDGPHDLVGGLLRGLHLEVEVEEVPDPLHGHVVVVVVEGGEGVLQDVGAVPEIQVLCNLLDFTTIALWWLLWLFIELTGVKNIIIYFSIVDKTSIT